MQLRFTKPQISLSLTHARTHAQQAHARMLHNSSVAYANCRLSDTHTHTHTLQYTESAAERLADGFRGGLGRAESRCNLNVIYDTWFRIFFFFFNKHNPWHLSANENQVGCGGGGVKFSMKAVEWRHSQNEILPSRSLPSRHKCCRA